jgi:NAD+ synthase
MSYELTREKANTAIQKIRNFIRQYFRENGLEYAIFGKSEGLDSSVVAGLLSNIEGVKPIGVIMPCESRLETERIARVVLDHYNIPWIKIDLTKELHSLTGHYYSSEGVNAQLSNILRHHQDSDLLRELPHKRRRAAGNIKARLRMITLYHIAQLTGGLVVSTDNLSEFWMGFWTINGDVGDFAPIQHVWKGLEENAIAEALGVPEESLHAVPTDGLDVIPGGTDEDQLGLPYSDLDRVIIKLLQNRFDGSKELSEDLVNSLSRQLSDTLGYDPEKIAHVARQMSNTHYKRNWPKVIKRAETGLPDQEDIKI